MKCKFVIFIILLLNVFFVHNIVAAPSAALTPIKRPGRLLVYSGELSSVVNATDKNNVVNCKEGASNAAQINCAASVFAKYDYIVLNLGLQVHRCIDGHCYGSLNYAVNKSIIAKAKKLNAQLKFFGTINAKDPINLKLDPGASDPRLVNLIGLTGLWKDMGAYGVFLDNYKLIESKDGGSYINNIHASCYPSISNAGDCTLLRMSVMLYLKNVKKVVGPEAGGFRLAFGGYNGGKNDYFLYGDYQYNNSKYVSAKEWRGEINNIHWAQKERSKAGRSFNVKFLALSTGKLSDKPSNYAWYSAVMDQFDGIGWKNFSADKNTIVLPVYPAVDIGKGFMSAVLVDKNGRFYRLTDTGQLYVDTKTHDAGFTEKKTDPPINPRDYNFYAVDIPTINKLPFVHYFGAGVACEGNKVALLFTSNIKSVARKVEGVETVTVNWRYLKNTPVCTNQPVDTGRSFYFDNKLNQFVTSYKDKQGVLVDLPFKFEPPAGMQCKWITDEVNKLDLTHKALYCYRKKP
ncbi:MAG: hypothetical protein JKY13_00160 [Gammaproteobacteria bacterium]|nr:hypothetical protein [Gammaproteobacteria bacterium]